MKLTIKSPEGKIIEKTVEEGVSCAQLIKHLSFAFPLLTCKVNHHYERLNTPITQDAEIELFDLRNSYANMSYQNTLILLYLKAIRDVTGKIQQYILPIQFQKVFLQRYIIVKWQGMH